MDQRFVRFLLLSFAILIGGMWINSWLFPRRQPPPPRQAAQNDGAKAGGEKAGDKKPEGDEKKPAEKESPEEKPEAAKPEEKPEPKVAAPSESEIPEQWLTLGSMDPSDPYRMLVTVSNRGAAVARIELNSPRFRDDENRTGYLGHIADANARNRGEGCRVRLVGPGTPAAVAGLRGERWTNEGGEWRHEPGDLITKIDGKTILGPETLQEELDKRLHGQEVALTVKRGGHELELPVRLGRHPLQMVHPEEKDPLSLLLTLQQLDDEELKLDPDEVADVGKELKGLDLWSANWAVAEADREHVTFRRPLAGKDLELRKTFRLAKVPEESQDDRVFKAYHLDVQIEIKNTGAGAHKVAYQLDGPTGLPLEGIWFGSKVSPASGVAGFRDVLFSLGGSLQAIHATEIAKGNAPQPYKDFGDKPVLYAGADTQYFAALLIPRTKTPSENWIAMAHALQVGPQKDDPRLTNVSCRLVSAAKELKPGESLQHDYTFFVGPKKPELVSQYGVGDVVYYGWPIFAFFAKPLVWGLHLLYRPVQNYGLAIILLTVLVRGCMFPMSRKQALNAKKMQELQPEIKKIQEKYKKDMEGRSKAQQELFRKHNYNPLGGCLLLFVQLPIFMGLYRALMIDVDLRGAALFTENIRWCSNLAAPDMFYDWRWFMPAWFNLGQGMFALGPYLNLLPIATVFLFNWQQKKMMPPPADEQQAMQQKIMSYMMIFMGLLFYKVASGLCIYFIASSLWGLAERQFLPKAQHATAAAPQTRADAKAEARAAAEREAKVKKKDSERK